MRHIVFLVGSYYPDFSAVGYCAYKVQQCLQKDSSVSVIAFKTDSEQSEQCQIDGIDIERIETNRMARRNSLLEKSGSISKWLLIAHRAQGAMQRLLAPETIDKDLIGAYLEKLESLGHAPDAIVPVAFPIEAVLAALSYKKSNPQVALIPYLFDDFVDSGSLHISKVARWLKRKRHLMLERVILEEADAIMAMHPLRKHFERNFEGSLLEKITFLEHPLLSRPQKYGHRIDDGVARLCFTGSLIKNVREADYLLELLRALDTRFVVQADFFVFGNDAAKVKTESSGSTMRIVNHGRVPKPEADKALQNADILINLGDFQGEQISSKVFEYIASGKPIAHLSWIKQDAVSKVLDKYPLALCLHQDRRIFRKNVDLLSKFIDDHCFSRISFDEVRDIYPEALPSTTAAILINLIGTAK